MLVDDEWDYDRPELPASPEPGELRLIQLGEVTKILRFVGIGEVDYSSPEPDVGWRGGPAVSWTFRDIAGRLYEVSPDEVLD